MYEELLRELGLSPNESRIYEALLHLGESSVQQIAVKSGVHRRNVYDSLAKLSEKGLAAEVIVAGEKHFKINNPRTLLSLIQAKEQRVEALLPDLQAKFNAVEEPEGAHLYKGIEGVKNYLRDILKEGETVYFIGAKALWLDPRLTHFLPWFQRERKKKGITFKHIFDHDVKEKTPEILNFVGKPYKFLPKNYSSPTCVDIFGDYVVTFVGVGPGQLPDEPVQFVLKSRRLADGYRAFFNFMWDSLPEQ